MGIYIFLVLAIILLPMFKVSKKKYCTIICIMMTLIVGFRDISMGMNDTKMVYVSIFDQIANMTFSQTYEFVTQSDIEVVFYMLTRFLLVFTSNARIYLMLLTIPVNAIVSRFIYKYSKIPLLSFLVYFSINYFAFSFTLLRHCLAMVILLLSYDYILEKKPKQFIISVFIAGLFHRTAWIFFPVYFFNNKKCNNKTIIIVTLGVLLFTIFFGADVYRWIMTSGLVQLKRYSIYINPKANTLTFFMINFCILLFSMIVRKKDSVDINFLLWIQMIGTCIASFMYFFSEMFRVSTFFTIFSIILFPNCLDMIENKKQKNILLVLVSVLLILYFFFFSMYNNSIYPYVVGGFER